MQAQLAVLGSLVTAVAYAAITVAIVVPVVRAGQVRTNRLATATALIFFSCSVGHGLHALASLHAGLGATSMSGTSMASAGWGWPSSIWDLATAAVAVYYWTLRRGYGVLLGSAGLYVAPGQQRRLDEVEARERVASQRAVFAAVIEQSDDAITSTTLDGALTAWNSGAERMFGYTADEALGAARGSFVAPGATVDRGALLARVAAGERGIRYDAKAAHKDGSIVDVAVTMSPVVDSTGLVVGTVRISRDLTVTRRAEAAQRAAEERIQQALAEARDQALEASRMKSQFLATMSHEIRTPMNGVIGLTDLLSETTLDPAQRRYVDGVRTAGDGLLAIINDILDFSKIEAGKFVLDAVDFRLPAVIADVAALTGPAAQAQGIDLRTVLDPDLSPVVRGDAGRLRQILLNLVSNAVKFTHDGSVTIRAQPLPDTARYGASGVCLEVTDTGIGMEPAALARLFQPFEQADASTTRRYGGTGLGLAISRQLVEAMGGAVEVDSTAGVGTTFRLTLPLPAVTTTNPIAETPDPSRLQILVVDDNTTNQLVLYEQVHRWGMHADVAADAEAALHLLCYGAAHGLRYDVAIIDMQMPGMSGLELASAIAAHPAIPALPVILMTSGEAISSTQARRSSIGACLTKPVSRPSLFDALTTVTCPAPDQPGGVLRGRILLVEDNDINQLVASGILTKLGYTVDIAADGIEALGLAGQHRYQVILMDCQMPRMDGYTATAKLRLRPTTARTPIIAMTANAFKDERSRCLDAGMDDYLPKPIRAHDLDAILTRWTGTAPATADLPTPAHDSLVRRRLDELLGDHTPVETAFIQKIVGSFIARVPGLIANIGTAIDQHDAAATAFHAHALMGAASNVGAQTIADACATIEHLALNDDTPDAASHHARLSALLDQTTTELTETLAALCDADR